MGAFLLYFAAGGSSFLFVFLKAFQQLNVAFGKYLWVMPTSFAMAACEVFVIAAIAREGWGVIVLVVGFGAGCGALLAMYLHKRFLRRGYEKGPSS